MPNTAPRSASHRYGFVPPSPDAIRLYRCAKCAAFLHGGYNLPGVEQHAWHHRVESTHALRAIFQSGDFDLFYRAVCKANAIRGDFVNSLWSHAMTLAMPAEHTPEQFEHALQRIPVLLDSLAYDDHRHARDRGLLHPVQQWP